MSAESSRSDLDRTGYGRVFRRVATRDLDTAYFIINEAAQAYRGLIPPERSLDPYMPRQEFREELKAGVEFWGVEENDALRAVMGIQRVRDVLLIRHAYVRPEYQGRGIGSSLLLFLLARTRRPVLIGTWAGASRAIRFYERHGFACVADFTMAPLLAKYWQVPAAQAAASVVLANVAVERLDYQDESRSSAGGSSSSDSSPSQL